MNRIITSIIVCLVMTAAIAQTKADSEVCYAMSSPNMRTGKILEADADNGVYSFVATGIQNTTRQISPVYLADRYEKVSRKDLLKAQRSFLDNPLGQINAKYGDKGVVVSGDVKFAKDSVVDLIETDYH